LALHENGEAGLDPTAPPFSSPSQELRMGNGRGGGRQANWMRVGVQEEAESVGSVASTPGARGLGAPPVARLQLPRAWTGDTSEV